MSDVHAGIVGAGFAELYMLHGLRQLGLSARMFEAGDPPDPPRLATVEYSCVPGTT